MSATEHISKHQFVEHLAQVPLSLSHEVGTKKQKVRYVPTSALAHVYSGEYDVPVHQMHEARSRRLVEQNEADYTDSMRHPGDHAGVQESLTQNIGENGIHSPVLISSHDNGEYGLADGSHRMMAAHSLNLSHVPVVVK